ncbi:hypothetical protein N7541_008322 [Penicillium brevicompactum]|uniref:Uncharacterized protein n=1 Tax=Penicillium brevicompactum TaxID=5074 RepID=A0A9W9R0A8_PENBR|nr:hypothetical protein N7541_008322 [Penicillium brevicompactum]
MRNRTAPLNRTQTGPGQGPPPKASVGESSAAKTDNGADAQHAEDAEYLRNAAAEFIGGHGGIGK